MPFRAILNHFVAAQVHVRGAMFCDEQGEMVELAQREAMAFETYDLRVIGASIATWVRDAARGVEVGPEHIQMAVRCSGFHILVHGLPQHYYLMAVVQPGVVALAPIARALHATAEATAQSM